VGQEGYGAFVADQLFLFTQMEFPWKLGPADGRYLLRNSAGEIEHIVVLTTIAAQRRRPGRGAGRVDQPAAPVPITRVTIIDPTPLASESQARSWLGGLDEELHAMRPTVVLDRLLFAQRIAEADPYTHEVSPAQASVTRVGWGKGHELAEGRFSHARELKPTRSPRRRRVAALRPQERLVELLGGRDDGLLCEELALRARADLDQGRSAHAALELDRALSAALRELPAEGPADLGERLRELASLHEGVSEAARSVLAGELPDLPGGPEELLAKALGRLEAALRARTAAGFTGRQPL
jgi:hypothetical protein